MNQALVASLADHTAIILAHAENLRADYDPHDLHQLRVHIRRNRSLLKRMKTGPGGFYLRRWKDLFAVTGRARDLDVFLISAGQLLPPAQFSRLELQLQPLVRASHAAVLELLNSGEWQRNLQGWRGLLNNLRARPPVISPGQLSKVVKRARKACRKARATGTDQDWHRFRIAVKNLRYVADASHNEPGADVQGLERIVEDCKVLQTLLGDWHDTVVQLHMLDGPEFSAVFETESARADIRDTLRDSILERKLDLLDQLGEILAAGNAFIGD